MNDNDWQLALKSGFSSANALLAYLELPSNQYSDKADKLFKTKVPVEFARKMRRGSLDCPLLRQVLPVSEETDTPLGFTTDPLLENHANPTPGLLHKYHGRVLVMLATSCAINCRYCFRRHFNYKHNQVSSKQWETIFSYIRKNPQIHEIILSGGDSLMLSNRHLESFITELDSIPQLKTLRFHTRLPVVIPNRINQGLLEILTNSRLNKVMVFHINHAQEICDNIDRKVNALQQIGVICLNQSVLLKGVNDSCEALTELSHRLFKAKIIPYYLHLLDKVQGSAHFEVSELKALSMYQRIRKQLPGYLVPRLVKEVAGRPYKTLVEQPAANNY